MVVTPRPVDLRIVGDPHDRLQGRLAYLGNGVTQERGDRGNRLRVPDVLEGIERFPANSRTGIAEHLPDRASRLGIRPREALEHLEPFPVQFGTFRRQVFVRAPDGASPNMPRVRYLNSVDADGSCAPTDFRVVTCGAGRVSAARSQPPSGVAPTGHAPWRL